MPTKATRSRRVTPAALLTHATRELKRLGTSTRAATMKGYFKKDEPVHLYGASMPQVRALARKLHTEVKDTWTVKDAVAFAALAMKKKETETRFIGIFMLARYADDLAADVIGVIEGWIKKGLVNNWALIDTLAGEVIAPMIRKFPALLPSVTAWHRSPNQWLRRAAIVPLVPFARRGEHLTVVYSVVTALFSDAEDLTHKASGWLLREAGTTNPRRLAAFLSAHGPAVPRTTLRYAIEKFPAEDRARLLTVTRASA
jgi:3-methyladenine DNA glycosylase AlkD